MHLLNSTEINNGENLKKNNNNNKNCNLYDDEFK